jgi:hypothetical protein
VDRRADDSDAAGDLVVISVAQRDEREPRGRVHVESRGAYGVPPVHAELPALGAHVGKKRVARLMREWIAYVPDGGTTTTRRM